MTVMYPQTQVWQITFKKEREGGREGGSKERKLGINLRNLEVRLLIQY